MQNSTSKKAQSSQCWYKSYRTIVLLERTTCIELFINNKNNTFFIMFVFFK